MHLKAVEAHLRTRGELPLNLKLVVEGEEEIGSAHFEQLVEAEATRLRADLCVVSDTAMHGRGQPSICVGLRGLVASRWRSRARPWISIPGSSAARPQSSGGTRPHPRLPARSADRRVTVPGFYDEVVELTARSEPRSRPPL